MSSKISLRAEKLMKYVKIMWVKKKKEKPSLIFNVLISKIP